MKLLDSPTCNAARAQLATLSRSDRKLLCLSAWYTNNNAGTRARFAFNTDRPPKQLDPLVHTGQPEVSPAYAHCHLVGIEAAAVILHQQAERLVIQCELQLNLLRARMFAGIGQGLLRDAIHTGLQPRRQRRKISGR